MSVALGFALVQLVLTPALDRNWRMYHMPQVLVTELAIGRRPIMDYHKIVSLVFDDISGRSHSDRPFFRRLWLLAFALFLVENLERKKRLQIAIVNKTQLHLHNYTPLHKNKLTRRRGIVILVKDILTEVEQTVEN